MMTIHEVLDYLNKRVGFRGLDNTGRSTDDRDDVITRQGFHKMVKEYNEKMKTKGKKIRKKKINQFRTEYYPEDIEDFFKFFKKRLEIQRDEKTEFDPALEAFGINLEEEASHLKVSKKLLQERKDAQENSITEKEVDKIMLQILDNFIDLKKVKKDAIEIAASNGTILKSSINYNDYLLKELK